MVRSRLPLNLIHLDLLAHDTAVAQKVAQLSPSQNPIKTLREREIESKKERGVYSVPVIIT